MIDVGRYDYSLSEVRTFQKNNHQFSHNNEHKIWELKYCRMRLTFLAQYHRLTWKNHGILCPASFGGGSSFSGVASSSFAEETAMTPYFETSKSCFGIIPKTNQNDVRLNNVGLYENAIDTLDFVFCELLQHIQ